MWKTKRLDPRGAVEIVSHAILLLRKEVDRF